MFIKIQEFCEDLNTLLNLVKKLKLTWKSKHKLILYGLKLGPQHLY
jgi:hypothetical protein